METLKASEEIKQLKARYFRLLDSKKWNLLKACLAEDITFDYPPQNIHVKGADALIENFSNRHASTRTAHTGSMPEIEIIDQEHAKGIWFMSDYVVSMKDDKVESIAHGFGHYFETYILEDGQWKIKSILLERLMITNPDPDSIKIKPV